MKLEKFEAYLGRRSFFLGNAAISGRKGKKLKEIENRESNRLK